MRPGEARALRAGKTLAARFTDFFTDFEKKPTVLQSSNHAKKARSRPRTVGEYETCLLRQYTTYSHITGAPNENIVPPLKHRIVERILVFKR